MLIRRSPCLVDMAGNGQGSSLDEPDKVVSGEGPQGKEAGHVVGLVGEGRDVDGVVAVDGVAWHPPQLFSL